MADDKAEVARLRANDDLQRQCYLQLEAEVERWKTLAHDAMWSKRCDLAAAEDGNGRHPQHQLLPIDLDYMHDQCDLAVPEELRLRLVIERCWDAEGRAKRAEDRAANADALLEEVGPFQSNEDLDRIEAFLLGDDR